MAEGNAFFIATRKFIATVVCNPGRHRLSAKINRLIRKRDATAQKQEFASPIPASVPSAAKHMLFYPSHDSNGIMDNSKQ